MKQDSLNGFRDLDECELIAVNGGRGQYDNSSSQPPPSEYEKFQAARKESEKQKTADTISNVVSTVVTAAIGLVLPGVAGIVYSLLTSTPDRVN
jgi:hypothetical protein